MSTHGQNDSRDAQIARLVEQWSVSEAEARGMLSLIEASSDELEDTQSRDVAPEDGDTE